jgi:L-alanine-DL-glutamate epimerase-like enolase superfamily enzyme
MPEKESASSRAAWVMAAFRHHEPKRTHPDRARRRPAHQRRNRPGGCQANERPAELEEHLKPWLIGNDADRIEDLWQSAQMKAYRRNGPVNNNVLAAMDMALWERGVLISERPT